VKGAADRRGEAPATRQVSRGILEAAHSLSVDLVTTEVVAALLDHGVHSILLKGPAIASWLYRNGDHRPYGDCDLLVSPDQKIPAQEVLVSLGFRYGYESLGPGALEEGLFWTRGLDTVDLHTNIHGIGVDDARTWAVLSSEYVERGTVGGREVDVLNPAARAMHIALHAAQHGRRELTPMADLARAVEVLPFEMWRQSAELAMRLDAAATFATGLALVPAGEAIVERLGIEKDNSVRALLLADTAPTVAFTLEDLRRTRGAVAKARFVGRKTFPTSEHMRLYYGVARRGRGGLALSYCQRIAGKLGKVVPGLIAWGAARRASR